MFSIPFLGLFLSLNYVAYLFIRSVSRTGCLACVWKRSTRSSAAAVATQWPLTCPRIAGHTKRGCLVKVKVSGKVHSIGEVVPMRNGKTFVPVFLLQETAGQAPEVIQLRSFNGFKPKVGEAVEVACDARAYGGEYRDPVIQLDVN